LKRAILLISVVVAITGGHISFAAPKFVPHHITLANGKSFDRNLSRVRQKPKRGEKNSTRVEYANQLVVMS